MQCASTPGRLEVHGPEISISSESRHIYRIAINKPTNGKYMGPESNYHVFFYLIFNYIVANGREEVPVRHRRLYVVKWQRGWGSW